MPRGNGSVGKALDRRKENQSCVTNKHAHRALADAIAEHECYQIMRRRLIDRYGVEGHAYLYA